MIGPLCRTIIVHNLIKMMDVVWSRSVEFQMTVYADGVYYRTSAVSTDTSQTLDIYTDRQERQLQHWCLYVYSIACFNVIHQMEPNLMFLCDFLVRRCTMLKTLYKHNSQQSRKHTDMVLQSIDRCKCHVRLWRWRSADAHYGLDKFSEFRWCSIYLHMR